MTRALSLDIRERVVLAVEGGLSRRSAAKRFGVAASTAIKWIDRWRRTGDVGPRPQGGDRRSQRIEAHSEEILALIEEKSDITLGEIAEHLEEVARPEGGPEYGLAPSRPPRDDVQKKPLTPANSNGLTSYSIGRPGSIVSRTWKRSGGSSSTRREPRPRWRGVTVGRHEVSGARHRCPMDTGRPPPSSARSGSRA